MKYRNITFGLVGLAALLLWLFWTRALFLNMREQIHLCLHGGSHNTVKVLSTAGLPDTIEVSWQSQDAQKAAIRVNVPRNEAGKLHVGQYLLCVNSPHGPVLLSETNENMAPILFFAMMTFAVASVASSKILLRVGYKRPVPCDGGFFSAKYRGPDNTVIIGKIGYTGWIFSGYAVQVVMLIILQSRSVTALGTMIETRALIAIATLFILYSGANIIFLGRRSP